MGYKTVAEVFDKPYGLVGLDPEGKWWISRERIALEGDGTMTIIVADGEHTMKVCGYPTQLRRLAAAIEAQVESAEVNSR